MQFCHQIMTTIFGRARTNLELATWKIAEKFRIGGAGTNLSPDYQLLVALLVRVTTLFGYHLNSESLTCFLPLQRRWGYDIINCGNEAVSQDDFNNIVAQHAYEDEDPEATRSDSETAKVPSKRPRLDDEPVPTVGKTRKGEDWWSRMDKRYVAEIEDRGTNWKATAWCE